MRRSTARNIGDALSVVTVAVAAGAIVWAGWGSGGVDQQSTVPQETETAVEATESPSETVSPTPQYPSVGEEDSGPQIGSDEPEYTGSLTEPERPMHDYGDEDTPTYDGLPDDSGETRLGDQCGSTGMPDDPDAAAAWLDCKHQSSGQEDG